LHLISCLLSSLPSSLSLSRSVCSDDAGGCCVLLSGGEQAHDLLKEVSGKPLPSRTALWRDSSDVDDEMLADEHDDHVVHAQPPHSLCTFAPLRLPLVAARWHAIVGNGWHGADGRGSGHTHTHTHIHTHSFTLRERAPSMQIQLLQGRMTPRPRRDAPDSRGCDASAGAGGQDDAAMTPAQIAPQTKQRLEQIHGRLTQDRGKLLEVRVPGRPKVEEDRGIAEGLCHGQGTEDGGGVVPSRGAEEEAKKNGGTDAERGTRGGRRKGRRRLVTGTRRRCCGRERNCGGEGRPEPCRGGAEAGRGR
jgi:hypothetical protein